MLIGPKYKICKRLGSGVFEKCQTQKFTLAEARKKGRTSDRRPRALSDYGKRLLEKQRVRYTYGLGERQLYNYVRTARSGQSGDPTTPLFARLELRLDNVVYRLGLAHTRRLARQMVAHGRITVNDRRAFTPARELAVGDTVEVREGSKKRTLFLGVLERLKEHAPPNWLSLNADQLQGKITAAPSREAVESVINLPAVVEYYSR